MLEAKEVKKNHSKRVTAEDIHRLELMILKLKKRIESMLESYDERITELEEVNAKLKEEYSKVFEMLPKYQKKKLLKKAESQ